MKIVELPGFSVVGISARTNNAKEMSSNGIIGATWQRFMAEGTLNRIPNRTDTDIIAMYTDYESDANGDYTFLLGAKVNTVDTGIPESMAQKQVPAARYAVLTTERGPVWQVVPAVWKKIWGLTSAELGGERLFTADFEIYNASSTDPQNVVVEVWVGIR